MNKTNLPPDVSPEAFESLLKNIHLEWALEYAKHGYHVFPCEPRGKAPLTDLVRRGHLNATTNPRTIRRWWTKKPRANIGLYAKKSGVIIVDVDDEAKFGAWLEEHDIEIPFTIEQLSGGGGRHIWFKDPGCKVVGKIPGADIKSNGYVIVAPSTHPNGEYYKAIDPLEDATVAPLPKKLLTLLREKKGDRKTAAKPIIENGSIDHYSAEMYLQKYIGEVLSGANHRNNGGADLSIQLRNLGLPITEAKRYIRKYHGAVHHTKEDPYTIKDAEKTVDSIYSKPPDEPARFKKHDTAPAQPRAAVPERKAPAPAEKDSAVRSAPREPWGKTYERSDLGNAERLIREYGNEMRYCHPWKQWLVWDTQRWQPDETGEANRKAFAMVKRMGKSAWDIVDAKERSEALKYAKRVQNAKPLHNMLTLAESLEGVAIIPKALDADRWLFNCANGTIDLRTGSLRPHRREDLITKISPVEYDPDAKCPRWEQSLREIFGEDAEVIAFFQRAAGYSLTGVIEEDALFIAYGIGANGKTTTLNTIQKVAGDYGQTMRPSVLMHKRHTGGPSEAEAALQGARFVSTSETGSGQRLDEATVKRLTGRDNIRARLLHKNEFEFPPTHKIWLATNHKPVIEGTDHAIWRRVYLIPYEVIFDGDRKDPRLPDKLEHELPGILAWAVRGAIEWKRDGLNAPATVTAATSEYQKEMDIMAGFLDECTVEMTEMSVKAAKLYTEYKDWAARSGETVHTQTSFGLRLKERGIAKKRRNDGWYYEGIGLKQCTV